ncbi:L-galactose dehydrogenase, partial [Aspergillus sp. HF37]
EWLRVGGEVGVRALSSSSSGGNGNAGGRVGASVVGVSNVEELNETLRVWRSVLAAVEDRDDGDTQAMEPSDSEETTDRAWSRQRRQHILSLFRDIQATLGPDWVDYAWSSPPPGFVNSLPAEHVAALQEGSD